MYIEFLTKNNFRQEYLKLFANRFSYGSLSIENEMNGYSDMESIKKIYNNMKAFETLLEKNENIDIQSIKETASIVNQNINFLSPGFRKINVHVQGASFTTVSPRRIYEAMYSLLDSYYNIWDMLPVYEREAMFHIQFIRIHPFEDGNGRTGRILMNYNLCKNNKPPIVIEREDRQTYFDFIENNRINELAEFIKTKSEQELEVMINLYYQICGTNDITSVQPENEEDIKIYTIQKNSTRA